MSSRKNDACKATFNFALSYISEDKKNGVMEELLFWGLAFLLVFLAFTCMRPTIFYLLETSGSLELPSAYHLAWESSRSDPELCSFPVK